MKGHALGRKALLELTIIVTPDTIIRWHRELVAKKWDHTDKRKTVGRPRIRQVMVDSILRFAREMMAPCDAVTAILGYDIGRIHG